MSLPATDRDLAVRRDAALQFLLKRVNYEQAVSMAYQESRFKLDRMRELLARLGNPHLDFPIVHVAGTKGKGSTSVMLGAVLTAAGYRTGVFTSPHLERMEERLAVDGSPCSSRELVELIEQIRPVVESMDRESPKGDPAGNSPTYFEINTAMALLHFRARRVAAAVLEVGLGGRLDSTNVCLPRVSVITSISLDHTQQLGDTLELIAREKAGIIKPGVPVVSGVRGEGARAVIHAVCRERAASLTEIDTDFTFAYTPPQHLEVQPSQGRLDFFWQREPAGCAYRDLCISLPGRHQAANAAVALAVLAQLQNDGWHIPEAAIRQGLANLRWPARVEVVARRPAIVVDAAHNAASIAALLETLDESFTVGRRLLLFATTREKDLRGMLEQLLNKVLNKGVGSHYSTGGRFDEIVFTRYLDNPRAVPPEELAALALELTGQHFPVYATPTAAWSELVKRATPNDLICVTGSFFIAAEIRRLIEIL